MTASQYFNERRDILRDYSEKINGLRKRMQNPTARRTDCFITGTDAAKAYQIEAWEEERAQELQELKSKEA